MSQPTENSNTMRAIIFDVETHSKNEPRVVETALMYLDPETLDAITPPDVQRFDPGVPIDFGALATHHILPSELVGMPPSESFALPSDVRYVVGHNIGFDLKAVGNPEGIKAIDTLTLSQRAWPDADSHKQSALYYMIMMQRGEDLGQTRHFLKEAHNAGVDIQICHVILQQLRAEYQEIIDELPDTLGREHVSLLESLHIISEAASVPLAMTFGKHEGLAPWAVPEDYKQWYCALPDANPYLVLSMRHGGNTPEGQAAFETAKLLFGHTQGDRQAATPAPRGNQRRFSF